MIYFEDFDAKKTYFARLGNKCVKCNSVNLLSTKNNSVIATSLDKYLVNCGVISKIVSPSELYDDKNDFYYDILSEITHKMATLNDVYRNKIKTNSNLKFKIGDTVYYAVNHYITKVKIIDYIDGNYVVYDLFKWWVLKNIPEDNLSLDKNILMKKFSITNTNGIKNVNNERNKLPKKQTKYKVNEFLFWHENNDVHLVRVLDIIPYKDNSTTKYMLYDVINGEQYNFINEHRLYKPCSSKIHDYYLRLIRK